ncbi:hypothetical protein [Nocardioides bruguierae]|uniref:hypothetical protein n=1 Tax=Nocardioides bruguierae TaxID=2945102 RepID=UPI002022842D|nr:hypothetical protein [Nocardioides bruguierae]MCL8025372.1 hypothetical protein [Nocardioides bruguierae]
MTTARSVRWGYRVTVVLVTAGLLVIGPIRIDPEKAARRAEQRAEQVSGMGLLAGVR